MMAGYAGPVDVVRAVSPKETRRRMIAVCPGSFDPVTHGHLDIIARAARLFSDVIVAVGANPAKNYLFTSDERVELLKQTTAGMAGVRVEPMSGLLVDFCRRVGASVIVKGARFASDFDYELQMAHMNLGVGGIETVLMPASREWGTISSTLVRDVARHGGDVAAFVPPVVAALIRDKSGDGSTDA